MDNHTYASSLPLYNMSRSYFISVKGTGTREGARVYGHEVGRTGGEMRGVGRVYIERTRSEGVYAMLGI